MNLEMNVAQSVMVTRVINSREAPITFQLEPWGEEYEMPPGAIFQVMAHGPRGDALEVDIADGQITVWGWPGSVVALFHEGAELGAGRWGRSPVPSLPPPKETTTPRQPLDTSAR